MKKYFRRVLALISAVSILFSATVLASAAQPPTVEPMYVGISTLAASLNISSAGLASCVGTVYNDGDYDVTMTIALQQDGSTIKSWPVTTTTGINSVQKSHYVASGHDYQVVVTAVVKSGSIIVNIYTARSAIVSY